MLRSLVRLVSVTASVIVLSAFAATADDSQIARGKYLVTLGGCNDCHTPGYFLGKPDMIRKLHIRTPAFCGLAAGATGVIE